jgi:hypothetical protein
LALMDLPDKHSDAAPKSRKQEVDMADDAMSGPGNSGKHANGKSDTLEDDSPGGAIDEKIEKALGDAQSLEDTIPLDVTRVIKSPKGQAGRGPDKAPKAGRPGAADTSSESADDESGPVSAKSESNPDEPASIDATDLPAGDVVVSVSLQVEPGRPARTVSHAVSTDATPAAGPDTGTSDPEPAAAADTIALVTSGPEAAAEATKAALSHASPFAIDLLMSSPASRATLAILASGLTGTDHAASVPGTVVAPTGAPLAGGEIEAARDNDPVAGMGEEAAPESVNEIRPGTPVQSLAATTLGVGLDEVVGRVERALDGMVEASSLRRLLPWLAGAGLVVAAVDVFRRQKSHRDQNRRENVGTDHDADTWLPRSITEKA